MIFRLWHKLVLTIIGITGVVLILALYISDQSVKKGFLTYINQVESNRLDGLLQNLIEDYQENNNWEFIRDNRRLWNRYNRRSRSPFLNDSDNTNNIIPRLNDIVQRKDDDRQPPRNQLSFDSLDNEFARRPPPRGTDRHRRPPTRGNIPPRKDLVLLDENKQFVMGRGIQAKPSSDIIFKDIKLDDRIIGYLQFTSFTKFTDELDMQFIQYQNRAFIKIALLALGIIFIGAALLAAYFRSRINKIGEHASLLTSGDFTRQTLDTSKDELGQLSAKLDVLGKTLEDNREARQRWVSDISHELRTPVAVLQGEIEALQDGIRKLSSDSINSLHHETLRLSRLINDLNQLSLSDIGSLNYVKEPLNVGHLVKSVIAKNQSRFDEKNILVNFNSDSKELSLSADEQRLEQLFSNLANNSLHYTYESGQLEIDISQTTNEIIIEWSDSKPGVTDTELKHLFERLYRVEESRNRNAGGSGLGLSICKNIVEAHEGEIIAKHSTLGGINFIMTFAKTKT